MNQHWFICRQFTYETLWEWVVFASKLWDFGSNGQILVTIRKIPARFLYEKNPMEGYQSISIQKHQIPPMGGKRWRSVLWVPTIAFTWWTAEWWRAAGWRRNWSIRWKWQRWVRCDKKLGRTLVTWYWNILEYIFHHISSTSMISLGDDLLLALPQEQTWVDLMWFDSFPDPGDVGQLGLEPHPTLVKRQLKRGGRRQRRNYGIFGTEVALTNASAARRSHWSKMENGKVFWKWYLPSSRRHALKTIENRSCSGSGGTPIQ